MYKVLWLVLCMFLGSNLFAQAPLKRPAKPKQQKAQVAKPPSQSVKPKPATQGRHQGYEWVDLGLPSGLKWATCNVGATRPERMGDYFSWGETYSKGEYQTSNYKWGDDGDIQKYCTDSEAGIVDGREKLLLSDDAARSQWGGYWRIPTKEECQELRTQCNWKWTQKNGVNGQMVTGPNGNSIFLPAAGYREAGYVEEAGECGYYWTSTLNTSTMADCLFCLPGGGGVMFWARFAGCTVRAVTE